MDDCGVCYGENADMDCAGVCFGDSSVDDCGDCVLPENFNAAMDDCGVCYGDNSSCTGCMDDTADNYDDTATIACDGCCEYSYSIDLHAGSNLISFYALPDDGSLGNVLSGLQGNVFGVIAEGSAAQPNPGDPSAWIGSLAGFDRVGGYWLKLNSSDVLDIFHGPFSGDISYDLHSGSNLISYSYATGQPVPDALPADFASHVLGIIGEGTATQPHPSIPGEWIGTLTSFEPTKGYWFKLDDAASFAYNAPSLTRNIAPVALPAVPSEYSYAQSEGQAFYFVDDASINGEALSAADWIIAYNGDVVVGARQWDSGAVDVPAMGYDHNLSMQTAGYCANGDVPSFKVFVAETNELVDMVAGDVPAWNENGIFTVNNLTSAIEIPDQVTLNAAYPNPFNPVTTIRYALPDEMEVTVTVIDMAGRSVATLASGIQSSGYHAITWNAGEQASGIYFIKLATSDAVEIQKVMLVK